MPSRRLLALLLLGLLHAAGVIAETLATSGRKHRSGKGSNKAACANCHSKGEDVGVDKKKARPKEGNSGSRRAKKPAKGQYTSRNRIADCAAVSFIIPPRMHRSRRTLGLPLDIGLGQEVVRRAFRMHARVAHPDMRRHDQGKDGDHTDWFAVARARADLLETINATGEDSLVGRAMIFDKIEGYDSSRPAFQSHWRDGTPLYLYYLPARDCWVVGHSFGGAGSALALLPLEVVQDGEKDDRPIMAWDEPQFWLAAKSDGSGGIDWVGQPKAQARCVLTDDGRRQLIAAASSLMTTQTMETSTSPVITLLSAFAQTDSDWLAPWQGRSHTFAVENLDQFGAIRLVKSICRLILIQYAIGDKSITEAAMHQHERQRLADICVGRQERRIAERLLLRFASSPAPPLHVLEDSIPRVGHRGDIVDAASLLAGDAGILVTSAVEDLHRRQSLKEWLDSPGTESFFTSPASVFACISDPFDDVLHNVRSLKRVVAGGRKPRKVDVFVSVVGGLSAFNYLLAFEPGAVEFFDVSQYALRYGKMVVELIRASSTRQEFISHLFSRSLPEFESIKGTLTAKNQLSFLQLPPEETLRNRTRGFLSDDAARAFKEVILEHQRISFNDSSWRQGIVKLDPEKYYRYVTQLAFPCEEEESLRYTSPSGLGRIHNSCTCYTCGSREETLQVVQKQDKCATWLRSWVNNCSFHYGAGWLQDAKSFNRVRRILSTVPVLFKNVDVLDPSGKFCATDPASDASSSGVSRTVVASIMDIFGVWNNFIDIGTTYRLQRHWAASCGASDFVLLQTLVFKSNLCRHWERGSAGRLDYSMRSCSEWS